MNKQEYYFGQIFEDMYPSEAADWCNANNAMIVELEPKNEMRRFKIDAVSEPAVEEKKAIARSVRDQYINNIQWRVSRYRDQLEMGIQTEDTEEEYITILTYIQYLRDYPETSATWYENYPLSFEQWIVENI